MKNKAENCIITECRMLMNSRKRLYLGHIPFYGRHS